MESRINFFAKGSDAIKAMYRLGACFAKSPVEQKLQHLIYCRVSQISGCAYCLDMHSKDLCAPEEAEQCLYISW